jgi:hypothetical protein
VDFDIRQNFKEIYNSSITDLEMELYLDFIKKELEKNDY